MSEVIGEVIETVDGVKEVPDDMEMSDEGDEPNYKTIPISNAKEGQPKFALCSEKDYEKVRHFNWHYDSGNYVATRVNGRYMSMHKMVLGSSKDGRKIDHINGNKYDNRQENLRFVTSSQNGQNKAKKEGASSKRRGVKFNKSNGKYRAYLTIEKDRHHLGYFENEVEAAETYDTYVVQNEFLNKLNFPEKIEDYLKRPKVERKRRKSSSKLEGVKVKGKKYEAFTNIDDKYEYIGTYEDEADAARAYDRYIVERKLYRVLNYPEMYPEFKPIRKIKTEGLLLDDGSVKLVIPTNLNASVIVNKEDYELIKYHSVCVSNGYALIRNARLNRFIMGVTDPDVFIDHIDGNPQNNLRSNLRLSDSKLNPQNQRKRDNTSSKYQGVSKSVRYNGKTIRWIAFASFELKSISLGSFKTEDIAARARDIFIRKTHVVHHYNLAFKWECPLEEDRWVKTLAPLWSPKARAILEKQ